MTSSIIRLCNQIIIYSFYALFFLVPFIFTSSTSELFEFNKMWVTFGISIIVGLAWISKMILEKQIRIQKTPLDLPILLFVFSQLISTITSSDFHTSIWGYYSRFNGGMLSILAYVFLYYAFVTNCNTKDESQLVPLSPHQKKQYIKDSEKKKQRRIIVFLSSLFILLTGVFITLFVFSQMQAPKDITSEAYQEYLSIQEFRSPMLVITILVSFFLFAWSLSGSVAQKSLYLTILSGFFVAIWGLPSHFGKDPTCLLFKDTFDVNCWTEDFKPTIRIFSTLGQPNWLAAYLAIIIFITFGTAWQFLKQKKGNLIFVGITGVTTAVVLMCLYVALLYTDSLSGFAGFGIGMLVLLIIAFILFVKKRANLLVPWLIITFCFVITGFAVGGGIVNRTKSTIIEATGRIFNVGESSKSFPKTSNDSKQIVQTQSSGGTESWKIRLLYVWPGSIEAFKHFPIFGSGVETFAYAYYKYRPTGHNLTSEWDYLYNKAHNEYLNYLTTTGIVGLSTYLLMIVIFLFLTTRYIFTQNNILKEQKGYIIPVLLATYISILVSNFFGFSVVNVNIYFYLIPALVFILAGKLTASHAVVLPRQTPKQAQIKHPTKVLQGISGTQWTFLCITFVISTTFILVLYQFWSADTNYSLGSNLYKVNDYHKAYLSLEEAVNKRPGEPTFKDEFALNSAALAIDFLRQKDTTTAAKLVEKATVTSDEIIQKHPTNLIFWKSRVKMFYILSQIDPNYYLPFALSSMEKAKQLAPTDAKVSYSLAVLYGQTGDTKKAIEEMSNTIKLKSDYRDAYFALGLFYHDLAVDKKDAIVDKQMQKKAETYMKYVVDNFSKTDKQALDSLKTWSEQQR